MRTHRRSIAAARERRNMEFLKDVFGGQALTFEQFAEKVDAAENTQLVNLAGGGYVDKGEHDALQARFDGVNEQLTAANKKLEGYDPEWKTKAAEAARQADEKVAQVQFDYALNAALGAAKARNATAVKALLNMDGLKFNEGTIVGLKEQLDAIKAENDFLFESEAAPNVRFTAPAQGVHGGAGDKKTALNDMLRDALGRNV